MFFFSFSLQEAGLAFDVKSKEPFQEINQILEHLKGGNVQSALAWCDRHKDKLHEMVNFINDCLLYLQLFFSNWN